MFRRRVVMYKRTKKTKFGKTGRNRKRIR
jgi:hypothetical protein